MTIEITYILIIIFFSFIGIFGFLYTCYRSCLAGYEISYYHEKYLGMEENKIFATDGGKKDQNPGSAYHIKEEIEEEIRLAMPYLAILQNPKIYLSEDLLSIKSEIYFANERTEISSERYHPDSFIRKFVIVEDMYERYQTGIQKDTK